jgi:hypothetical protein
MAENLLRLPQRKRLPFRRAGFDRDTNAETAGQGCVPVPLRRNHRIEKWKNRAITRLGGERLLPIQNNKVDNDGVVYLTSGGFGGGLENFTPTPAYFKAANRVDYHMVLFTITNNSLQLRAYDKDGQLFDTWTKSK